MQEPFTVSNVAQAAATASLEDSHQVRRSRECNQRGKRYLVQEFERLGLRWVPSEANFVLVKFGARANDVCQGLREKGLLVRDRSHEVPGTIRITAGKKSQVRKLLKLLPEVMNSCAP